MLPSSNCTSEWTRLGLPLGELKPSSTIDELGRAKGSRSRQKSDLAARPSPVPCCRLCYLWPIQTDIIHMQIYCLRSKGRGTPLRSYKPVGLWIVGEISKSKSRINRPRYWPGTYLPFYAAKHHGYYREEGLEVEFIQMPANLASTAVLTKDIDYNGAVDCSFTAIAMSSP